MIKLTVQRLNCHVKLIISIGTLDILGTTFWVKIGQSFTVNKLQELLNLEEPVYCFFSHIPQTRSRDSMALLLCFYNSSET